MENDSGNIDTHQVTVVDTVGVLLSYQAIFEPKNASICNQFMKRLALKMTGKVFYRK